MGIRCLIVHVVFEPIINQIKDKINARYLYLKTNRKRVWDLLESFLVVNLISIPIKYNQIIDALAKKIARLYLAHNKRGNLGVKVLCKPSILEIANF